MRPANSKMMMPKPRNLNDVMSGGLLVIIAALGFVLAWPLDSFVSIGLGPGYVPKMFALILGSFGGAIAVHGFVGREEPLEGWSLRPLVLVLGAVAFFGLTVDRVGLVVALVGMVTIACAANRSTRFYECAALAVFSAVFSVLVFIKALGLTIPVWPSLR